MPSAGGDTYCRVSFLQTPPFEQALPGITMLRLMELIPQVPPLLAAGSAPDAMA